MEIIGIGLYILGGLLFAGGSLFNWYRQPVAIQLTAQDPVPGENLAADATAVERSALEQRFLEHIRNNPGNISFALNTHGELVGFTRHKPDSFTEKDAVLRQARVFLKIAQGLFESQQEPDLAGDAALAAIKTMRRLETTRY